MQIITREQKSYNKASDQDSLEFGEPRPSTHPCPASKSARVAMDLEDWDASLAALEAALLAEADNDMISSF